MDHLLAVLTRVSQGDEAALEAFYNATASRVYGLAMKIVSNPELAEEVVGDVFLQVWRTADDFDEERAIPLAWVLMICRSRALDRLRKEKRITRKQCSQSEQAQLEETETPVPFEYFSQNELCSHVHKALQALDKRQRQLIMLAFYKGMSHQEISDYTGDPLGTVKSNIRRAQSILRQTLSRKNVGMEVTYG